jgi:hypothetical protein
MSVPRIPTTSKIYLHLKLILNLISFAKIYVNNKLPLIRLLPNMKRYITLWYLHEMEVAEFFYYYLWREELTEAEYRSFIGWKKHIRALISLNPLQYRCLTENKLIFFNYCTTFKVPTPEVYAVYDPNTPDIDSFPVLKNVEQLADFVDRRQIDEFILKPIEGTRGQSILILTYNKSDQKFRSLRGMEIEYEKVKKNLDNYTYRGVTQSGFMVQERLIPHQSSIVLSRYVPFSYRVLTILDQYQKPHIIEVYGKSAVGESDTDNWEGGGLSLRLDANGVCFGANNKEYRLEAMKCHPTNGFNFIGWQAPFYKEVCEIGIQAAKAFHHIRCVAWDIIVSAKGVYVIEGNNPWSVGQQEAYYQGLWQGVFGREAEKAIKLGPAKSPWW